MTNEEIFSQLATHMTKGLMVHNQIAIAFGFLNLCGYQKCHEYHFYEESKNYRELHNYYLMHFHKIILENEIEKPQIVPNSWLRYTSFDVDINTKREAIRELMKKWIEWEEEAKKLFEVSYKELYNNMAFAPAMLIKTLLLDTTEELAIAQKQLINLESMNYDMTQIISEQESLYKKYNEDDKK